MSETDLAARLAALEARVAALEGTATPASAPTVDSGDTGGELGYQGSVRLHGQVEWGVRYAAVGVLDLPVHPTTLVLAALGHPIRVAMVRRLLTGPASAAELQEAAGVSSTGQLYHHVRSLTGAGVAEQDGRANYRIPPKAVVPVMVLLLAAADVGGVLGTRG